MMNYLFLPAKGDPIINAFQRKMMLPWGWDVGRVRSGESLIPIAGINEPGLC